MVPSLEGPVAGCKDSLFTENCSVQQCCWAHRRTGPGGTSSCTLIRKNRVPAKRAQCETKGVGRRVCRVKSRLPSPQVAALRCTIFSRGWTKADP